MTTEGGPGDADDPARPALRVVRGDPTVEELAALVAVLSARSGADPPVRPERPRSWSAYWRGVRQPLRPGPDGWRDSARPR